MKILEPPFPQSFEIKEFLCLFLRANEDLSFCHYLFLLSHSWHSLPKWSTFLRDAPLEISFSDDGWYLGWNKLFLKIPQNWIDDGGGLQKEDIILTFPPFQVFSNLLWRVTTKRGSAVQVGVYPLLVFAMYPLGEQCWKTPTRNLRSKKNCIWNIYSLFISVLYDVK